MENMLRISNPGLSSRFALENALQFDDFTDAELLLKFSMDCVASRVLAPMSVKKHAVERLAKLRNMPNFGNHTSSCTRFAMRSLPSSFDSFPGNARACESLVKKAVQAASARGASSSATLQLQMADIDAEFGESDPLTLLKRFKVFFFCQTRSSHLFYP